MNMQDESHHFIIVAELYVLFVVIILSFIVILNLIGILVAKEVLNIVEPLGVE